MKKERKFVIGDIHSHYDEMMELFEMVHFDFNNDLLISLGDLVDRGTKPIEVVEEVMKIKRFIHILGNHDEWCYQYLLNKVAPIKWLSNGGRSTYEAYQNNPEYREKHLSFFKNAKLYFIDINNRLFVHAGFNPEIPFNLQQDNKEILIWDRSLFRTAMKNEKENRVFPEFDEIFIGHSPTQLIEENIPKKFGNLWMLDTGVFISGKLTLMNIETKEYWQSSTKSNQQN